MNNQNNEEIIKGGLLPLKKDGRDFSLLKVFGSIRDVSEIPNTDFVIAEPLEILNQGGSSMCVAFAASAVSSDQEKVVLSPEYLYAKGKQLEGDWASWGMDLRTIVKVLVNWGSIKREDSPYEIEL